MRCGINASDKAELAYFIDSDLYTNEAFDWDIAHARRTLADFNRHASRAFGWCILPELRDKLRPSPINASG